MTIKTSSPGIELVAARLTALGHDSFIMDDQADFHDFLSKNHQYWDYVDQALEEKMAGLSQIRLYLENGPGALARARELERELARLRGQFPSVDFGPLAVETAGCRDEDWENNWKRYYRPLPIGKRLLVVPQWLDPENPEGRVPVRLDPGMIFGTGAHASTRMCMLALEEAVRGGERVIDLGCGSGILSITALLLGASQAVGVDIDPKAEDIARENAALNGLGEGRFQARSGNVLEDGPLLASLGDADLVLANIVAGVILPLAPAVPKLLRRGGRFICSGILDERAGEVRAALERAGLRVLEERGQEGWRQFTAATSSE